MIRTLLARLRSLLPGGRFDADLDEEIRAHIEMATEEYVAQGKSPEAAVRAARRDFGGVDQVKERYREALPFRWIRDLGSDVRIALRGLRRRPGFALATTLTLAIAIGSSTAVFSVLNGVLLKSLPFDEPDRLMSLWDRYEPESGFTAQRSPLSLPEVLDYRDQATAVEAVAYYQTYPVSIELSDAEPARVAASHLSAALLPTLGVPPALGRWFEPAEALPDGPGAVILSHTLWVEGFSADPNVVGQNTSVNGSRVQIIGVMPEGFGFPDDQVRLYLGVRRSETAPGGRDNHGIRAIARLADDRTFEEASAELETLMASWAREMEHHRGHFVFAEDFRDTVVGNVRVTLWSLMAAVGLVLLVASANVANLLMARGEARSGELAVRMAIGAGRGRMIRHLLAESLCVSVAGGILGVGIAAVTLAVALGVDPTALPRAADVGLSAGAFSFAALTSLGTALLVGLAPALLLGDALAPGVRDGMRATTSRTRGQFRRGLIVAEVALSVVVVIGAGLLARSLDALTRVESGMASNEVLAFDLALSPVTYTTPETSIAFFEELVRRLENAPGIENASFAHMLPIRDGGRFWDFGIDEGRLRPDTGMRWSAFHYLVGPGFLEAAGIPLLQGRSFSDQDAADTELVGLIGETAASELWPGEDPLGKRLRYGGSGGLGTLDTSEEVTIVGVVGDVQVGGLASGSSWQVYLLHSQEPRIWGWASATATVLTRTDGNPTAVAPLARRIVSEMDPTLALGDLSALSSIVDRSVARPRLITTLFGWFAAIAITLAAVGIYGIVSFVMERRTREIGIRVALGATGSRFVASLTREGVVPAALGLGVGLAIALAAAGRIEELLFETATTDLVSFIAAPSILLTVAVASSLIPSVRAAKSSPIETLKGE